MAHAYTPGLQVTASTILRKRRLLPLKGDVLVEKGQRVEADTIVAQAELPGDIHPINVANRLGCQPAEMAGYMLKHTGDAVVKGEPIARTKSWLKFLRVSCPSPATGTIQSISEVTGQVMVQEPPRRVELPAYLRGRIVELIPGEGAVVETRAAFMQGIFGIGGECNGPLAVPAAGPDHLMEPSQATAEWKGAIVVAGQLLTADLIQAAIKNGAVALIGGGIPAAELYNILGYEIGVAITGAEQIGLTLVVTEGFGRIPMAEKTYQLLKKLEGRQASVSGATQIRAGVKRPEIIVPLDELEREEAPEQAGPEADGLAEGDAVRLIREPYFGRIGQLVELVPDLQAVESEARVRVMRVGLGGGQVVTVPRANVEVIKD